MCGKARMRHGALSGTVARRILSPVTPWPSGSSSNNDAIVGYRTFVAVIAAAYFTLIALTPRTEMMHEVAWAQLLPLSALYLVLGIWGFDFARRRRSVLI